MKRHESEAITSTRPGGTTQAGSLPAASLPAQLIPLAATAEQLGFLRAPPPQCLGRADSPCEGDHSHDGHDHSHGGHGHSHGGHGHGHDRPSGNHEHQEDEAHEHMRVFPVFELDPEGQVVESVDEEGRVGDYLRRAMAETEGAEPRKGEMASEAPKGEHRHPPRKSSAPRKPRKQP